MDQEHLDELAGKITGRFLALAGAMGMHKMATKVPVDYLVGQKRFFGDYYAPFLAEIAGLRNDEKIVNLGSAYLFGRAYTIAQDKLIDDKDKDMDYIILAPALLTHFIHSMTELGSRDLMARIDTIVAISMKANMNEHEHHRGQFIPYDEADLYALVRKTGIIQIPPYAACRMANNSGGRTLASACGNALVAIQICDDLADIEEDFNAGNYTIPVTQGYLLSGEEEPTLDNVCRGLFLSGLFESLLSKASGCLEASAGKVGEISRADTHAARYLKNLQAYLNQLSFKVYKTKEVLGIPFNKDLDLEAKAEPVSGDHTPFIPYLKELDPANLAPGKVS
jgi:hypothetical protein